MATNSVKQEDTISLKIPHHLVKMIDEIAAKEDRSRSSLIRKLIISFIEDYEDIIDAKKARVSYKNNPNSATSLDDLMKKMKVSKKELDKIKDF